MITYCTGHAGAKRRAFRAQNGNGAVNIDNDEVLAYFCLDGQGYCVVGDIPFGSFTATEYVAYMRALRNELPSGEKGAKKALRAAGFGKSFSRRLSHLSITDYRRVSLAAKTDAETRVVYINFDGLVYSRRNGRDVRRMLARLSERYEVYAAVSDARFIPKKARISVYPESADGGSAGLANRAKTVRRSALRKRLQKKGWTFDFKDAKRIVLL